MLRKAGREPEPNGKPTISGADKLADFLEANRDEFKNAKHYLKDSREVEFYKRYVKSSIAYDFTFDMTEDNFAGTQLDFVNLITHPLSPNSTFGSGISASNDRMRQNIRKFLVTDTFDDLLRKPVHDCDSVPAGPNLLYPIIGNVGLYELSSTFIDLNEEGLTLAPKDKAPALADQLQFNTTFTGSVTPKIILSPIGHAFRLADASLTNSESRTDKHTVLIGLSLPPKAPPPTAASPVLGVGILSRSVFAQRILSPSQTRAVEAITQFRIDLYYDRSASVVVR